MEPVSATANIESTQQASPNTLKSLFNAKSMLKKIGRDALVSVGLYAATLTALTVAWDIGMERPLETAKNLAQLTAYFTLYTTALVTTARYVGGMLGMAGDAVYDKVKDNPPLTTQTGRRAVAATAGVAAGGAAYLLALGLIAWAHNLNTEHHVTEKPAPHASMLKADLALRKG